MAISTNLIKSFQLSALTTALALAGCGGGGGNDTLPPPVKTGTVSVTNPSTGTDSTTTTNLASVKKVQLVSTSSDFYMNVGDSVELTVYALNSNNIGVASVPVSVQITDPSVTGVFSGISPNLVTDDTGKAVIKLDIKSLTNDQKNYLKQNGLVVTTTVGKVSTSKTLKGTDVNTTTPTPTVTVSNLLLISDSQNIALVKGTKINVTALAVDKDNNIIPNTTIDFNIGNSVLSGIFANSNLSVLTNDRGEANLELELKSLSDEQKSYLLNTGLTINSTARTGSVASNTINLKGVEQGSTTTKLDVQKVNLTTPKPNFNVQVGEKFTVTASVLNSSNTGLGGVPVQFKLDDPSATGVYAVSDTSNVVTNASGEATIELEVKSEAAKAKLLSQGINITATAKNTTGTTPVPVTGSVKLYGVDPTIDSNVAKVARVGLSTTAANNTFDLTVGNTFTVTANVVDSGQGALANVPVTFTLPGLDQTGIANLSGSTVKTDSEGKATINLSISSLNATQRDYLLKNGLQINASVPNGTPVSPLKLNAKQVSSETDINSISVIADSDNILMAAGSTVKVTAIALDKNFGGLANQILTVKIPDPSTTGVFNITGSTITTDSKGEATLTLQVKSTLTAAQKQALANGLIVNVTSANGKTGQIKLTAKAVNDVVANSVTLTSNVNNIPLTVGSQFTVTATVNDAQNGVIANAPVTFSLPSLASYGVASLSASTVSTNAQGQAVITLQVQSLTDAQKQALLSGFTINATSNGKQATPLTLKGVDPITRFDVKAVKVTSPVTKFNVQIGERFTVTASVLNGNNTGIGGTPVQFTLDNPALTGIYSVSDTSNIITNAKGEASIELEVKSEAAKQLLLTKGVTIKATAKNTQGTTAIDVTGATTVLGVDPTVSNNVAKVSKALLVSSVNPFELAVGNKISVTAVIADASNGKLDGVPVSFVLPALDQTGIANLSGSTVTTNSNGEAVINLEIKSLTATQRSYLATNGLVVKATVPNGTTIAPLKISAKDVATPATVETVSVTADSNNIIMAAGSHVKVTAVALDKNFGGLKGQVLTVNIPNPSLTGVYNLSGSTITTDEKGEAVIDLEVKSPLTEAQKQALTSGLNITVTSQNGKQGDIKLAAKAANEVSVSSVTLTSDNIPLVIGSQVKVKATVLDAQRGVIKNAPVTFNLPDFATTGVASLSSSTVLTDDKGEAIIVLEVKSLTDAQKQALLNGFTVNATSNGKAAPALTLKGVDTSVKRLDVKSVKLTSPVNPFNIKIGERFTVTASVLNGNNTGIGGAPVEFKLNTNPSVSGVYAVSDTSNITTNASGEATIELEVKSTAAKNYLIQNGISIQAVSKNTMNTTPADVTGNITLKGVDPSAVPVEANIALVKQSVLSSSLSNNIFDLTVGTTFDITATVADANQGPLSKVPVTFSLPGLESTGIANLSGSTVTTDTQGKAVIKLRIDALSAAQRNYLLTNGLVVNATVPNGTKINPIKLSARDAGIDSVVTSIAVTADRDDILMMAGSKVHVTASALNGNFGGVPASDLTFSIPDPALTNVFNITGTTVKTDEKGEASIDLEVKNLLTASQKAYLQNGLKVKVTAPSGATGEITLKAKAVNEVSIDKVVLENFPNTPVVLSQGNEFIVMAHTVDAQNGAVTNAPVTFNLPDPTTTGIVSLSPSTVLTSEVAAPVEPMIGERAVIIPKGTAYIRLRVIDPAKAEKLIASGYMVKAVSNGNVTQTLNVPLTKTAAQPTVNDIAKVNLVTDVNTLTTNNGDTINVTAQVRDAKNFSLANMPVSFTLLDAAAATGITNTTPLQAITNANGEAVLTLKVGALTPDQKYYLQTSGLSFKATAGAITSSTVTLKTQEAITANSVNSLLLTSDSAIQLAVGSKVKVTALAIDKNGAVVPNAQVSFKVPTDSGLVNNTGAVVNTNANGEAIIEVEIKDLAKATTALQNGLVVTAQSGVSVGTTTVRSATSNANTPAYQFFVNKSKDSLTTGSDEMTLTIHVTDTKGGIKANVPVYLQILDNGVSYGLSFDKTSSLTTDSSGNVVVTLKQSDIGLLSKLNHDAKVKVIVNDGNYQAEEQTLDIAVSGTVIQNATASQTSVLPTDNVTLTGTLLDGTQKGIANTNIELFNENDPTTVVATAVTNAAGTYSITKTVSQLGADVGSKINLAVRVSNQANPASYQVFSNLYTLTKLTPNTTTITVSQNGVNTVSNEALVDQPYTITVNTPTVADNTKVYLSTTKGQLTVNGQSGTRIPAVITGGKAVFSLTSGTPGNAVLTVEDEQAKPLLSDNISFISRDVQKFFLNSDITIVNTNGEAKVVATVKDSLDRPIKNAIVEFSLVKDASGGRISNAYVLTDETGLATIRYYAGKVPTAVDAVQIKSDVKAVRVGNTDMLINSPKTAIKTLTVQNQAASIGVSFSDKVASSDDEVYYIMNGSIYVVNSTGKPVVNQPVSVSVIPDYYRGGEFYAARDASGNAVAWGMRAYRDFSKTLGIIPTKIEDITCRAEDLNLNNILDVGEDTNTNGKLDPFNPVAILGGDGSVLTQDGTATLTTDATGKLDIKLRYAKDTANWFTANVRVTTKVDGTEYVQQRSKFEFPVLVTDITDFTIRPNWRSPFADGAVINPIDSGSGYNVCLTPYK
nr:Ig-like domain-containing protein [Moraxella osloensis]